MVLMPRDRERAIREKIAAIMKDAEPTAFSVEGPCRHGVRSSLCLQGWGWTPADMVAAEIVAAALNTVGARRPTWYEGQPEYTQPGAFPIERDTCVNCRKPLPEGHWKFCSKPCGDAHHGRMANERSREEINAVRRARMAAWSANQPKRLCDWCGRDYPPKRATQRYCCGRCAGLAVAEYSNGGAREAG